MYPIKQSTSLPGLGIFAHDNAGNGVTGLLDAGFTKRIKKAGGAWAAMTVTIAEGENGWYDFTLSAAHTDTLGMLEISISHASCQRINLQYRVESRLVQDLVDSSSRLIPEQVVTLASGRNTLHTTIWLNGKLFAVDLASPCHIIRFDDPVNDLTRQTEATFASDGFHNAGAWQITYSSQTGLLYVLFQGSTTRILIDSVDPVTMAITNVVNDNTYATISQRGSIVALGAYLYVIPGTQTAPELISRFALSGFARTDLSLTALDTGHAIGTDGVYIYATGGDARGWIVKVDPATFSSFSSLNFDVDQQLPQDDLPIVGAHAWQSFEAGAGKGSVSKVNLNDFSTITRIDPGVGTLDPYGIGYHAGSILVTYGSTPGKIAQIEPETGLVQVHTLPPGEQLPNEIISDGQRLWVTFWQSPARVGRFTLSQATQDLVPNIADAVWDETVAATRVAGSYGDGVRNVTRGLVIAAWDSADLESLTSDTITLPAGLSTVATTFVGCLVVSNPDDPARREVKRVKAGPLFGTTWYVQTDAVWVNPPDGTGSAIMIADAPDQIKTDGISNTTFLGQAFRAAAFHSDLDIYSAKVWVTDDDTGTTDRYGCVWFKNGNLITTGITTPLINVYRQIASPTDLVASTAMTQVGTKGVFFYNEATNRLVKGVAYDIQVDATIGGANRTFIQPFGQPTP